MKIILDNIIATARVFRDDAKVYGDPYDGVFTVQFLDNDTCYLSGLLVVGEPFKYRDFKQIQYHLNAMGYKKLIWKRGAAKPTAGKIMIKECE